ncbi:MAG: tetratricopeptide repeat protein, partial [Pseudomonadota bacterium]
DEAKPLFERAVAIDEKTLGAEHPNLATSLNNLAGLLQAQVCRFELAVLSVMAISQGNYDEAKSLYQRAIAATEKALGADHPDVANRLNNLATLLHVAQVCRSRSVCSGGDLEKRRATTTKPTAKA